MSQKSFEKLRLELREIRYLAHLINLAVWDQQVYLPSRAAEERGEQLALLAKLRHERLIADPLFELVQELDIRSDLSEEQRIVIDEVYDDVVRARKKPVALIAALAEQESRSHAGWLQARQEKNFSIALPSLKIFLQLKQEYASAVSPDLSRYDALLDDFEKGARTKTIFARFNVLKPGVLELRKRFLKEGMSSQENFSIAANKSQQETFFIDLAEQIGFDFSRGRLDPTVHPFMSEMGTHDVRLTTRFQGEDLFFGLFGFLHEMGHGLYEQGMREEWAATPLAEACSLAMHESQSLLYEKQLGLSFGFQNFLLKKLKQFFPDQAAQLTPEKLFRKFNSLNISLNRLSSDELGYTLHIILRTELEEQMLSGALPLEELPAAWAKKSQQYFGRTPKDDLEGVLQDIHWYIGLWGYFPHYLGGAMYSAQLINAFAHDAHIANLSGEKLFEDLLGWLRKKVHHKGRSLRAEELMKDATGSVTDPKIYLKYLKEKYEFLDGVSAKD